MAEWSNVPDSKSGVLSKVPRVRIPPSPPPAWLYWLLLEFKKVNRFRSTDLPMKSIVATSLGVLAIVSTGGALVSLIYGGVTRKLLLYSP